MEKKEIVVSTLVNCLKPIKLLYEINNIQVKWRKITIGLPKERKYAEDRAYPCTILRFIKIVPA